MGNQDEILAELKKANKYLASIRATVGTAFVLAWTLVVIWGLTHLGR